MKTKLALTALALVLMNSAAFADCSQKYAAAYDHRLITTDGTDFDTLSLEAGVAVYGTATGGPAIGLPLSASTTSLYVYETYQKNKVVKPYNLIQDAEAGQGIMLKEFAKDAGISQEKAAEFVRQANSSEALCANDSLMGYDEIVALAKKQ